MFPVAIELRRAYGNANGRFNFFVVVLMPEKLPEALETFRPVAHLVPASCGARRDLQWKMKRNRASPGGSIVRLLAQFLAS